MHVPELLHRTWNIQSNSKLRDKMRRKIQTKPEKEEKNSVHRQLAPPMHIE